MNRHDSKGCDVIPHQQPGPLLNGQPTNLPDTDPEETDEWLESLDGLIDAGGRNRARYVMLRLNERARDQHVGVPSLVSTDFVNTIPKSKEVPYPGEADVEQDIRHMLRWNAAVQVHRAQRPGVGVGGHISSYASSATLYEVGLMHFWRGKDHPGGGDQIYFQGHSSPGMYARAYLEGRLSEADMDGFRQEYSRQSGGRGLPSYPHPRRMSDFWEFPTVSMGIGPINAIYQASFNKYLDNRGIKDTTDQHVWAFLGDGEMDEIESRGALQHASNEGLDNLTFVVNCNLQRLDGPVRGNGKIIQELESFFRGAGWNVIKLIWGANWDPLLENDHDGALVNVMNMTRDGDYQTFKANDGAYVRKHFFGQDPRTEAMVEDWTDDQIWALRRGGLDYTKIYNAYKAATEVEGKGAVMLVADTDFLADDFCVRLIKTPFGQIPQLINENLTLFSNVIEQFAGREELIGVRSRGVSDRPFRVVNELEAEATKKWQAKEEEFRQELQQTRQRLAALQSEKKSGNERMILSQEQQNEIVKLRKAQANTSRQLKNVRLELTSEIDSLGLRLKVANIVLVPVLVVLFGLLRGLRRRRTR